MADDPVVMLLRNVPVYGFEDVLMVGESDFPAVAWTAPAASLRLGDVPVIHFMYAKNTRRLMCAPDRIVGAHVWWRPADERTTDNGWVVTRFDDTTGTPVEQVTTGVGYKLQVPGTSLYLASDTIGILRLQDPPAKVPVILKDARDA